MNSMVETILILLVLTNIAFLGLSMLGACIRVAALQGILIGIFTILSHPGEVTLRLSIIASVSILLKGFVFPLLLSRAIKEAGLRREIEPLVGYIPSILGGIVVLAVSIWLSSSMHFQTGTRLSLVVPASFMTLFTGLFLVVTRRKALTQALGYLVFENGIYTFGVAIVGEIPTLVELGVLLDGFVAILVMGIAIYHINREFDHIDADRLSALKG
jgi:hydrogenase-4 component E